MIQRIEIMDYRNVLKVVASAISRGETVEIYYPATERSPEGWREIEPEGFFVDVDCFSQKLIYQKDEIFPGHILNAKTLGLEEDTHSFIIGKIRKVRSTGRKIIRK